MPSQGDLYDAGDAALWISISELARRKGVTQPAISDRIKRLAGKIELRPGKGREKLVNVAQFDLVTGENTFAAQARAAATVRELAGELPIDAPAGDRAGGGARTLTEAQRQKLLYDTGLLAIRYANERGAVVPIEGEHGLAQAMREIGGALKQAVDRLPLAAAELVALATREGERGVRIKLKALALDFRRAFADACAALAEKGKLLEKAGGITVDLPAPLELLDADDDASDESKNHA